MKKIVLTILLCCMIGYAYSQEHKIIYPMPQSQKARSLSLPSKISNYLSLEFVNIDVSDISQYEQFVVEYNGKQISMRKDVLKTYGTDDFYFRGHGDGNITLSLSVMGNDVLGSIEDEDGTFSIETVGNNAYAIIKYDPSKMKEGCEDLPENQDTTSSNINRVRALLPQVNNTNGNNCKIRVLVLYTPQAAAEVGNIRNTVRTAVEYTNESFSNSNIHYEIELVYLGQTDYTEIYYVVDLSRFVSKTDGYMDEVHTLRDKYSADICILLFYDETLDLCGRAGAISASSDNAFSIVNVYNNCATDKYSFGHEIGHLLGCRHDPAKDSDKTPFAYGHGYVSPDKKWRTIMAYPGACNYCQRLKYWSNPDVLYNGVPMGTTSTHNNARVWNERSNTVMGFRQPANTISVSQSDTEKAGYMNVVAKQKVVFDGSTIKNGASMDVKAGEEVELKNGVEVEQGAEFSISIGNVSDCGNQ